MKTTTQISINIPSTWIARLRELSHKESLRTGKEIIYTDLIRDAILQCHPEMEEKKAKPK
jgi:hypothetical protein